MSGFFLSFPVPRFPDDLALTSESTFTGDLTLSEDLTADFVLRGRMDFSGDLTFSDLADFLLDFGVLAAFGASKNTRLH